MDINTRHRIIFLMKAFFFSSNQCPISKVQMNQFCMTFGKMSDIYVNWIIIFNVIDSIFHSSSIVTNNNAACLDLPKNLNIVKSLIIIKNNSPRTSTCTLK